MGFIKNGCTIHVKLYLKVMSKIIVPLYLTFILLLKSIKHLKEFEKKKNWNKLSDISISTPYIGRRVNSIIEYNI